MLTNYEFLFRADSGYLYEADTYGKRQPYVLIGLANVKYYIFQYIAVAIDIF